MIDCTAQAIYAQARGQDILGMKAVGHVIQNRVQSSRFPNTPCKVVHQSGQFTFNKKHRPRGPSWFIAQRIARNLGPDVTGGALFFHHRRLRNPWPRLRRTRIIGRHIFYRYR